MYIIIYFSVESIGKNTFRTSVQATESLRSRLFWTGIPRWSKSYGKSLKLKVQAYYTIPPSLISADNFNGNLELYILKVKNTFLIIHFSFGRNNG